jgi:hypothetical protein
MNVLADITGDFSSGSDLESVSDSAMVQQQLDDAAEAGWSRSFVQVSRVADLLGFAEWAFGPTGFPKLLILAYGDFSYDGRYGKSQVLFCRNSLPTPDTEGDLFTQSEFLSGPSFRIMSKNDEYLWDRIGRGSEVLSVGPVGDILKPYED